MREINIAGTVLGGGNTLFMIAGPCVIESEDVVFYTAERLKKICKGFHANSKRNESKEIFRWVKHKDCDFPPVRHVKLDY